MELRIKRKRHSLCMLLGQILAGMLFTALPTVAQQQPVEATSLKDQLRVEVPGNTDPKVEIASSTPTTSNDRLFYTLPNFMTLENSRQLSPPLTAGQKFRVVARGAFDYVEIPWIATLAGISQGKDTEAGYGQGMAGYGKRFGAALADNTTENFMIGAVIPSLLKEDPRYYQMGSGPIWRRSAYAASHLFVTRSDSGRKRFNFSEILGSALAAGICTYSYHHRGDRTLSGAAAVWERQLAFYTLNTFIKEFWPDLRRKLSHK
jgi:hypothetical protein